MAAQGIEAFTFFSLSLNLSNTYTAAGVFPAVSVAFNGSVLIPALASRSPLFSFVDPAPRSALRETSFLTTYWSIIEMTGVDRPCAMGF